jgi:hypothetical protein
MGDTTQKKLTELRMSPSSQENTVFATYTQYLVDEDTGVIKDVIDNEVFTLYLENKDHPECRSEAKATLEKYYQLWCQPSS